MWAVKVWRQPPLGKSGRPVAELWTAPGLTGTEAEATVRLWRHQGLICKAVFDPDAAKELETDEGENQHG